MAKALLFNKRGRYRLRAMASKIASINIHPAGTRSSRKGVALAFHGADRRVRTRKYLLFSTLLVLMISLISSPVSGEEETLRDEVDRDAYISDFNYTSNYGDFIYLYCGSGFSQFDTIMHFTLANRPVNYRAAYLRFSAWSVSTRIETSVFTASSAWSEETITFQNKPLLYMLLARATIAKDGWCQVDITEHVRRVNEISFCLTSPNASDFMYIFSREYKLANYTPHIEWVFVVDSAIPGFDPWLILGLLATISIAIMVKLNKAN